MSCRRQCIDVICILYDGAQLFMFFCWHAHPIFTENIWQNSALAAESGFLLSSCCLVHSFLSDSNLLNSLSDSS